MKALTLCLVAMAAMATAQPKPVSSRAAFAVLRRHETAIASIVKGVKPVEATGDATPLSRSALILEFERFFDQAKPSFRWTPTHQRIVEPALVKNNADPKVQAAIRKLSRFGCIAPVGPIVVGPGDTLTAKQFGDAVGFFAVRITNLIHQPDPKWTPNLTFDTGK